MNRESQLIIIVQDLWVSAFSKLLSSINQTSIVWFSDEDKYLAEYVQYNMQYK